MSEAVLEARDVHARYHHAAGDEVLAGISLGVARGEIVAILGPNGAGKSTLLRVMSGTLRPERGEVRLFGAPLASMDRAQIARRLAVVSQTHEVAWGFSVRDVVTMGRAPHQAGWLRASAADRRVVDEALARCDLEALASRPVQELSGGEQKRVAIARALAQKPEVLLLDEPSAFLDVRHQVALYDLLADVVAREQVACAVVMHDLNVAAQYASRVALVKRGRMIAVGAIEEVMTYGTLRETFDADLYCGVNEIVGARFFLPMRGRAGGAGGAG